MNMMSENINELFTALAKAQATMKEASKDGVNPFHKSKYATLDSIWDACRDSLTNNGLSVIQTVDTVETKMVLCTILGHVSGQWIKGNMPIIIDKPTPQSLGSALTYAKRYSLAALVGISSNEDDDAESVQQQYREPKKNTNQNHLRDSEAIIDENQLSQINRACQDLPKERLENMNKYISKTFGVDDYKSMKKKDFEIIMRSIALTTNNNKVLANV